MQEDFKRFKDITSPYCEHGERKILNNCEKCREKGVQWLTPLEIAMKNNKL